MVVMVALVTLLVMLALRQGGDHADRVWIHKSRGTEHQQRVCSRRVDGVAVASWRVMIGHRPSGWLQVIRRPFMVVVVVVVVAVGVDVRRGGKGMSIIMVVSVLVEVVIICRRTVCG